jgi:hypothetical protein
VNLNCRTVARHIQKLDPPFACRRLTQPVLSCIDPNTRRANAIPYGADVRDIVGPRLIDNVAYGLTISTTVIATPQRSDRSALVLDEGVWQVLLPIATSNLAKRPNTGRSFAAGTLVEPLSQHTCCKSLCATIIRAAQSEIIHPSAKRSQNRR